MGTVRTFSAEVQAQVEQRLVELCSAVAAGFGATAHGEVRAHLSGHHQHRRPRRCSPATSPQALVGARNVERNMEPSMGAEDFSFMLQKKPGAYLRIGQGAEDGAFLHNSRYDFNDEILPLGRRHARQPDRAGPAAGGRRPMENAKAQAPKLHASSAAH